MRFSYAESMVDPSFYPELAMTAEAAGYDSMVIPDSICYPLESDSIYPFNPDGSREFLEDKPFIEPFSLIPALGAVTSTLQFVTFVVKLPIRHPVLVAKQATSVAVLTNNRFKFGVGSSPWREDYEITEVPWERRGQRMDESMEILKGLMAGGFFEFHGEIYNVPPIKLSPIPSKPIPLLVGGHGEPALKRAARLGDGWLHGGGDLSELPGMIDRLHELRREYGKESEPFEIHVISLDAYSVEGIKRLEEVGVTDVIVGFRYPYHVGPDTEPLSTKLDNIKRFADDVIAKVR
jgi:probable F420-dependent oxidoreductase